MTRTHQIIRRAPVVPLVGLLTFLGSLASFGGCASVKDTGGGPVSGGGGNGGGSNGSGGHMIMLLDSGTTTDAGTFIGETNEDATCGFDSFDLHRRPVELFVLLDRSASMKDDVAGNTPTTLPSKWAQLIPALTQVIAAADPSISWGMKTFPEDIPGSSEQCANATVTSKIDVPVTPSNAAQVTTALGPTITTPEGDGTPTGAAVGVAVEYLKGLHNDDRKFILLATDGEPSCGGTLGNLTKDTASGRTDAVAAVTAAASPEVDIHTFVVGVATTKATAITTLNQLAVAGKEMRADPNPAATKFYLASTQSELVATLQSIVMPIANNCVFTLAKAPPDPTNIAVKVGGAKSDKDTTHANGWDYTDASHTQVQVFGSWCDQVKKDANMVQIVYGCPGFEIP